MPTVNLLPNADESNSPAWTLSTGSDIWALLDDETSNPATDTNQITATAAGKKCIVEFENLDSAGLNIDSINSVQAEVHATIYERAQTYTIGVRILDSSNTELWAQETSAGSSAGSWTTHTFTARTTDGIDAWNDTDIDGIRMEIEGVAMSGYTLRVGYAKFIIDYAAAVPTYPSDDNIIIQAGEIEIKGGNVTLK
jgi:hypothetical protein